MPAHGTKNAITNYIHTSEYVVINEAMPYNSTTEGEEVKKKGRSFAPCTELVILLSSINKHIGNK